MNWEFIADCGTPDIQKMTEIMRSADIAPDARTTLLTAALANSFKELARSHYQVMLLSQEYQVQGIKPGLTMLDDLELLSPLPAEESLRHLPDFSWMLTVEFRLLKSYLSRDDRPFYIIDNPVRKEKIFKVPMVAPSQWKGALLSAMVRDLAHDKGLTSEEFAERRFRLDLLFGDEKGEEEGQKKGVAKFFDDLREPGTAREAYEAKLKQHFHVVGQGAALPHHAGRLRFYPSYFDKIGMEIINPHDREKGIGKNPIPFECVPAGATARFTMLYLPLDLIGRPLIEIRRRSVADLHSLTQGIEDMFSLYGFGAKTSSSFGLATCGPGRLTIKAPPIIQVSGPEALTVPDSPDVIREFLERFPDEDFTEKPKVWRKKRNTSAGNQEKYAIARQANRDYLEALAHYERTLADQEKAPEKPAKKFLEQDFEGFSELQQLLATLTTGWRA